MNERKIIIAHNNRKFIENAVLFFSDNNRYIIDKIVKTGEELLKIKKLDDYHIVIVKDALAEVSGLYALRKLLENANKYPDHILLITPFLSKFVLDSCDKFGITPVSNIKASMEDLYKIIYKQEIEKDFKDKKVFNLEEEVNNLLRKIGILKSYLGYKYFEYVLKIILSNNESSFKYMKNIYQITANYYNVSPLSVEKAMRTCIKSSFSNNYGYYASLLFGKYTTFPTTSTFVQICAKILKEQRNYVINNQIREAMSSN